MNLVDFTQLHVTALEAKEVRHNLILGILANVRGKPVQDFRTWTFGSPSRCAAQTPAHPIVLADLTKGDCQTLAEDVRPLDFPGIVGPDETALQLADRAAELGLAFCDPTPQQILALSEQPSYPGAPGYARPIGPEDAALLAEW